MRKLLYSVCFGLILCLGIYSYNSFNTKEVSILNNDILNDYEDIIIKRGNENGNNNSDLYFARAVFRNDDTHRLILPKARNER